jgi:hypothetical protein
MPALPPQQTQLAITIDGHGSARQTNQVRSVHKHSLGKCVSTQLQLLSKEHDVTKSLWSVHTQLHCWQVPTVTAGCSCTHAKSNLLPQVQHVCLELDPHFVVQTRNSSTQLMASVCKTSGLYHMVKVWQCPNHWLACVAVTKLRLEHTTSTLLYSAKRATAAAQKVVVMLPRCHITASSSNAAAAADQAHHVCSIS